MQIYDVTLVVQTENVSRRSILLWIGKANFS